VPGSPRDLLHAAVMLRAEGGEAKIVSADDDFDELAVEVIERLDPADIEVWRQEVE
jgi:predicted nucleic acid-binding protein